MRKIFQCSLPAILITGLLVSVWGFVLQTKAQENEEVTLDTTVLSTLTFTVDSATKSLGDLTPGTAVTATSTLTVGTNSSGGFTVKVVRNDADTTMDLTTDATVNITDQTAWNSGTPNSVLKSALENSGDVLAFRVKQTGTAANCYSSTWWGTDDTDSNAKYAGFPPTTAQTIVSDTTYEAADVDIVALYYLDVATSQKTGTYDGKITYTATAQ